MTDIGDVCWFGRRCNVLATIHSLFFFFSSPVCCLMSADVYLLSLSFQYCFIYHPSYLLHLYKHFEV
ncbi:hypothetical protein B9Z55_009582 [Caenorhabditis nigoni]|uniref:Uncharacterized protein n=1 Tax=Caenorhabditis nigoni TaxID=1611254 RepID=A0A2G5USM0_9PELO|nr:hypothetical protein B9Z55_009582 [Caenorhabditis nigoni]